VTDAEPEGEPLFTVQWETAWSWEVRGPAGHETGWGAYRTANEAGAIADRLERAWAAGLAVGRTEPTAGEIALAERRTRIGAVVRRWVVASLRVTRDEVDWVPAGVLVDDLYLWLGDGAGSAGGVGTEWRGEGPRGLVRDVVVEVLVSAGCRWEPFSKTVIGVRR
jgi:hypothetical protein